VNDRELEWAVLMRAANSGDAVAYVKVLRAFTPVLRVLARRGLTRAGLERDTEDVVQETLLAVHLKRHTWDGTRPIGPWLQAIARHKLIDATRRRGRRIEVSVDDLANVLPAPAPDPDHVVGRAERYLETLPLGQRNVVRALTVDGATPREAALQLNMSEGAVRVALHRGLAALAARFGGRER
jgi:RNA polymerase sigma-70 factor (ECF subfamily)